MLTERELGVRVRAFLDEFTGPMRQAEAQIVSFTRTAEEQFTKVEQSTERMSRLWKSLFEAFLGFEMIDQLKKIAEEANHANDALEIAARTAENFGHGFKVDEIDTQLKKLASSAQGGGYSLSSIYEGFQKMIAVGASPAQSIRLVSDAIGLAAARNLSLSQAMQIAQYAATGHTEMLSRYGIVVKDAAGKTLDFATVMKNWETDVAGAAEARAKGMEGAFGNLSQAVTNVAKSVGAYLIPFFTAAANAAAALLNTFASLPGPVREAITVFATVVTGLTAFNLMLPGVVKVLGLVKEGVILTLDTLGLFGKGLGLVGTITSALLSPLRNLVTWIGLMRDAFAEGAIAEWAAEAPIAGIIMALAALGIGVYELVKHWNDLGGAMHNFISWAQTAFHEFVTNMLHDGESLKLLFAGIASAMGGNMFGATADIAQAMAISMPKTAAGFTAFAGGIADAFKQKMTAAVNWVKNVLFPQLANFGKGPTDWSGLGGPGKPGSQQGINDALTAAKAAIEAPLAAAKQAVDDAKSQLAEAKSALGVFHAKYDGEQMTPARLAEEQRLVNDEIAREQNLRTALAAQQQAETTAAQRYKTLAQSLPAIDKTRVAHMAELNKAAAEHADKAIQIRTAWLDVSAAIAQAGKGIRDASNAFNLQEYTKQRTALEQQYNAAHAGDQGAAEEQRFQESLAALRGASPVEQAQMRAQAAQFAEAAAKDKVAFLQHALTLDKMIRDAATREQKIAADTAALTQAKLDETKATHDATLALGELSKAKNAQGTDAIQSVASRVPGLSEKMNDQGGFGGFSFNPWAFLADAVMQSRSFADIMAVVNDIMRVFSQIIDALRPVIDMLLQVLLGVVGVFVDLWNAVAKILQLFGIHIKQLQLITGQDFAPLVEFFHDLPTLNELASGQHGPYQNINDPLQQNVTNPLNDTLKSPGLGGGILGVLGEILGAILALKLAMGLFGGGSFLSKIFGSSSGSGGFLSKIGSLLGTDVHLFGGSATIGSALLAAVGGSLVGKGLQDALGLKSGAQVGGALGGVGGMFAGTALFSSLGWAAGPLGALAGAVLGSLVGGLFGSKTNPHDNPDMYPDSGWGQDNANLWGATSSRQMHANGQSYVEDPQLAKLTGGKGLLQFLADYVAGGGAGLTDAQKKEFQGLDVYTPVTGGKNGTIDLANGVSGYYTQIYSDAMAALQTALQGGASAISNAANNVAANLAAGATNVRANLSAAGNELAGNIAQKNDACAQATTEMVSHLSDVAEGIRSLPIVIRKNGGGTAGGGDVVINYNHNGDNNNAGDVEEIGQTLAEGFVRGRKARAYSLTRRP